MDTFQVLSGHQCAFLTVGRDIKGSEGCTGIGGTLFVSIIKETATNLLGHLYIHFKQGHIYN